MSVVDEASREWYIKQLETENARLRMELTVHAIHRFCVSKTKHEAELTRLREDNDRIQKSLLDARLEVQYLRRKALEETT